VCPSHKSIRAGLHSLGETLPEYLPAHWSALIQPEGQLYFYNRNSRVVTDAYIYNPEIFRRIEACTSYVEDVIQRCKLDVGRSYELYLNELDSGDGDIGYYFADHETRSIFWLAETNSEDLDLPAWTSPTHLKWVLREQYWSHVEIFSMHINELSTTIVHELFEILSHARTDHLTSLQSTFPYDADECARFLELLRPVYHTNKPLSGNFVCLTARIWSQVARHRHVCHFGEEVARLSREQRIFERIPSKRSILMNLVFKALFDLPDIYEKELSGLWVDQLAYANPWKKYMSSQLNEWNSYALLAMLLLMYVLFVHGFGAGSWSW
jgi:hypothetical protein